MQQKYSLSLISCFFCLDLLDEQLNKQETRDSEKEVEAESGNEVEDESEESDGSEEEYDEGNIDIEYYRNQAAWVVLDEDIQGEGLLSCKLRKVSGRSLTHLKLIFTSYRNQSTDLLCRSIDLFLYDFNIRLINKLLFIFFSTLKFVSCFNIKN